VRIGVRLTRRPPPFPAAMPPWERLLAWATQAVFYLLMLVLPLTGWAIVSAHAGAKISFWGLPWPAMPGIQGLLGGAGQKDARESLAHLHVFVLIWILVLSLALHVAGALWHQFRAPPVLWRMGVGRRSPRLS
jgi:cytochrome b561